ncbi:DUF4282 domain-containing protein [Nocardioides sp. GXQ0305]|uniref:DUF4282 domain-containing protein n=1 Tax=Nocardioides sp. GXQ0305 TaxID=3423912 RepID=UPI003D7E3C52
MSGQQPDPYAQSYGGQPPYEAGGGQRPYEAGGGQPPYEAGGGQPPYGAGGGQPPYGGGGQPPYGAGGGQPPGKGFFGALFDFSFEHFVTPMLVKAVYIVALVALGLGWLFWLVAGFAQDAAFGVAVLILGPILLFLYLCLIRMTLEFYLAIVRMSQDIHQRLR